MSEYEELQERMEFLLNERREINHKLTDLRIDREENLKEEKAVLKRIKYLDHLKLQGKGNRNG